MLGPKIEISHYDYVPLYLLFILFILQEIVLQLSLAYLVECVLSARGAGTMSALMSSLAHVLQMMASSAATRLMQQTFAMCETQRLISTSNALPPPPLNIKNQCSSVFTYYLYSSLRLPEHVSCDEGALLEPLSVAVQACLRAEVGLGSKVLVCGAGPMGLVCMLAAKAFGASSVLITGKDGLTFRTNLVLYSKFFMSLFNFKINFSLYIYFLHFSVFCCYPIVYSLLADIDEGRLRVARELGATHTVQVTSADDRAVAKEICATMGCQPDISIECSGAEASVAAAIYVRGILFTILSESYSS